MDSHVFCAKSKLTVSILAITLVLACPIALRVIDYLHTGDFMEKTTLDFPEPVIANNTPNPTTTSPPISKNSSVANPQEARSGRIGYYDPTGEKATVQPNSMLNETSLLPEINALGATGGRITLKNDLAIIGEDVLLPSNVVLCGVNSEITIFLESKHLEVARKCC
jgi:hypothetical protein